MIQRIRPDQCYRSERMPPGIGVIGAIIVCGGLFWCPVLLLVKWALWG